jgi:hypothetical protein
MKLDKLRDELKTRVTMKLDKLTKKIEFTNTSKEYLNAI